MTTKNNGLDEMFFEQFEELTDEELAEVSGGDAISNFWSSFLPPLAMAAEAIGNPYSHAYFG